MAYKLIKKEYCTLCINDYGPTLGVVNTPIKEIDGQAFKNLSGMKALLPYEDWRLQPIDRARDLASRLSIEEIAGLMLFSPHQHVPFTADFASRISKDALSTDDGKKGNVNSYSGISNLNHISNIVNMQVNRNRSSHDREEAVATYHGVSFEESEKEAWELTDDQKRYLTEEHMRYFLLHKVTDASTAARWGNELQVHAEAMPFGIPVCVGSDMRHCADSSEEEYNASANAQCSLWPKNIGLAATFSPELAYRYGEIVAKECRAMGITVSLSPQADLGSDPRWMRYSDTFGANVKLVADMARAYCDGLQTTAGSDNGWGQESVAAIAKHWPGGGTGEGGRDAHYPFGKYSVYPGDNMEAHIYPFTKGVLSLEGPTKSAAGIMPYYAVAWKQNSKTSEDVGHAYNENIVKRRLREKEQYDGIVCTDWGITEDPASTVDSFGSRCYGVEKISVVDRHLQLLMNDIDQFGGNSSIGPIVEAYELGCTKYGVEKMRKRMEASATRILVMMFRLGLFENPYVDPEESSKLVAAKNLREEGKLAQLQSVVMLKNRGHCLPLKERVKVYIPERKIMERRNFFREKETEKTCFPVEKKLVEEYFDFVDIPERADVAIVFLDSPDSDPYSSFERKSGANGYLPISLQYRPYTANFARKVSIAGGDIREGFWSRSYHGKTVSTSNIQDLYNVLTLRRRMKNKPIIACIRMKNPTVLHELEPFLDAILIDFGVEKRVLLELLSGQSEPNGLLPMILPKNMETVEKHCEDIPFDMEVYKDSEGTNYSFGFGLNWSGKINDDRLLKYKLDKSKQPVVL